MTTQPKIRFSCPACNARLLGTRPGTRTACPSCGIRLQVPGERSADITPIPFDFNGVQRRKPTTEHKEPVRHSALGIASFLIAALVGSMDVLVGLVLVVSVGTAGEGQDMSRKVTSSALSLVCLNCLSAPVCLIGIVLGATGAFIHRNGERKHILTYIGLGVNTAVVAGLLTLYLIGAAVGNK